jgi:hypothetical protein
MWQQDYVIAFDYEEEKKMSYYEKCNQDEFFAGNISVPVDKELSKLRDNGIICRVGLLAYDIHGEKLLTNYMLPLFIKKESHEKYERLMMDELRRIRMG